MSIFLAIVLSSAFHVARPLVDQTCKEHSCKWVGTSDEKSVGERRSTVVLLKSF